jgi:RNA polymerase sigma-70 factor (ECF subfamily)
VNEATIEPMAAPRTQATTESFGDLYERSFDRVYAYVQSMLRDRAAAEDVVAQAFERAYRKRGSYRPRRGSAEAWLFGIARNAALDELRRRKRHARMATEPEDLESQPLDDVAETALRRETVRTALEALDPRERELVSLKYMAGLSNAEIAKVVGISESNTSTRLNRTMTKLREVCHEQH